MRNICKEAGCENFCYGRGLCKLHYQRLPEILAKKAEWVKRNPERRRRSLEKYNQTVKARSTVKRYQRSVKGRFVTAQRAAEYRNLSFTLTQKEFEHLVSTSCHYCRGPLPVKSGGLDRLDNSKGYESGNVVPCCGHCNIVKNNRLTEAEMLAVVELLQEVRATNDIWATMPCQSFNLGKKRRPI